MSLKYYKPCLTPLILFWLCIFGGLSSQAAGESFKINQADSLEMLDEKVVLQGNVSISSTGEDRFTLLTDKLISLKDSSGQYGDIECFGVSRIVSARFNLRANKLFFRKDKSTGQYNRLDASGAVLIEAKDGTQKIEAPEVQIDLLNKKLYASQNVCSEQLMRDKDKTQRVKISSDRQEIDLTQGDENNATKTSSKQLIATGHVQTLLEGEVTVESQLAEIFKLNGKAEKAVFTGGASLNATDGSYAQADIINYYLDQKLLHLQQADTNLQKAKLTKPDGTEILGQSIKYNSENRHLFVQSSPGQEASLKIPYKENDGSMALMSIQADIIENTEQSPTESLLTAHRDTEEGLVQLNYGLKKGWGRHLFIKQNKDVADKKADYLLLIEEARIFDAEKNQDLKAPVIKIGLGQKNLQSGFTGRAEGYLPMDKASNSKKTKR